MGQTDEVEKRSGLLIKGLTDNLLGKLTSVLPGATGIILDGIKQIVSETSIKGWDQIVQEWIDKGWCDTDTGEMLKRLRDETFPVGFIVTLVTRLRMLMIVVSSVADIMGLDRQYDLMSKTTPNPAPAEALVRSMMIDPARASENRQQLKRLGYSDTQIDNIILSHYATVDVNTVRMLYMRGKIDKDRMFERMRELGFTDTRIKEIVQTWEILPGPSDLFTMVAHEAFEPELYGPMGLADEFPSEQLPWLAAQGISEEWAMKYWISHWEQPSILQGFEMLHRGVITRDELNMLMKVVEIPPYWRDKLMQITYNPFTRVDTRRMHELGVLSTEELVTAYQDIGYDAEKAVKMAEFTIRFNAEGDNKVTRSAILTSYHDDLITRSEAIELLTSQNLSRDAADYYLTLEDYKIAQEATKIYTDTVKDRFMLNIDNETVTRDSLNKLGLRGSKIDALIDNWKTDLYKYQALPTKAEINTLLVRKIITEGQWREIMTRHGYSYEHQNWYLKEMEAELTVSAALPSRTDLQTFYKKNLITAEVFRDEMRRLGYADHYIDLYLKSL